MKGVIRPKAIVLPDQALVPDENLIRPEPNQFTHEITRSQPYYYKSKRQSKSPDGEFPTGTKVVLLVYTGGDTCRVADRNGLYVETLYDGLKKI